MLVKAGAFVKERTEEKENRDCLAVCDADKSDMAYREVDGHVRMVFAWGGSSSTRRLGSDCFQVSGQTHAFS